MKNNKILVTSFGMFCLLALASFGFGYLNVNSTSNIEIALSSSKTTYLLGEPIPILIEVNNLSEEEVVLTNTLDPIYGSLKFYVSSKDKSVEYQYMNPKSGILDVSGFIKIKPDENQSNSIQVLARLKSYDQAEYVFSSAGNYDLQVSYQIQMIGQTKPIEIKSNPVKITIQEPVGENLEVWNKIKNDGNFAYFIQEGDVYIPYRTEEREKFLNKVEQIINQFPNSFYAESLRQSLTKFRADEAKRQEAMEKLKQKQSQ